MISTGELAALRRECERTMQDSCQILRPANVDDAGGMVTTYSVITITHWSGSPTSNRVACRVAPGPDPAREEVIGGALQGSNRWRVTVPAETAVDQVDLISVGSSLSGSGLTMAQVVAGGGRLLEVLGVAGARTMEMQRIVYVQEIG